MSNSTQERIKDVIQRFVTNEAELNALFQGEPILESVSIDSLAIVHMVTDLEKEFGIRFELETIEQVFDSIATLEAFLTGKPD